MSSYATSATLAGVDQPPAPDKGKQKGAYFHRPELDVLRFFSFLMVLVHHSMPTLREDPRDMTTLAGLVHFLVLMLRGLAGMGPSVFFALSAFLIFELLLREKALTGTIHCKAFYLRRILRIWPLYFCILGVGLLSCFTPYSAPSDPIRILCYALFLGAWYASSHGWTSNPISPLWSISVEEQFYLFAPWIVRWLHRKGLYCFCALLPIISTVTICVVAISPGYGYRLWANSLVHLESFAGGILICLLLRHRIPAFPVSQRLLLLLGTLTCWSVSVACCQTPTNAWQPGHRVLPTLLGYTLISLGATLLLLATLGIPARLCLPLLQFGGKISLGLYLFHAFLVNPLKHHPLLPNPILQASLVFALSLLGSFLLATGSYRWLETPFLRMKSRLAVIRSDQKR